MTRQFSRLLTVATVLALAACASVPLDYPREPSYALTDTADTSVGTSVARWTSSNDGLSGFHPLTQGMDAFAARLRLIEVAESSIDLQYFLMKDDTAGRIIAASLLDAADRGVRVRFLIDDVFTTVSDEALVLLNRHENIEIRLFNPIARGAFPVINYAFDFSRANRRMHNKSFTVDNQVTILGGRNIADEYYEIKTEADFLDFDVIGVGKVATDVSESFDLFWNHGKSIPVAAYDRIDDPEAFDEWREAVDREYGRANQSTYQQALGSALIQELFAGSFPLYPAEHQVLADDPGKLEAAIDVQYQDLANQLGEAVRQAQSEILVVTPYLVPMPAGMDFWRSKTERGLRVVMITNSLASNNHIPVHSAYAKYRPQLVDAGVELYEARVDAVLPREGVDTPEALTLHTKAVIIDRETLYAGSLNLDPRSIEINAESGVLVHSRAMVEPLAEELLRDLEEFAYRIELDKKGNVRWTGSIDGIEVVETREPQTTAWRRFLAFVLKIVPDSQL